MTRVRLEPATPRSQDKHSTTEPLRSDTYWYTYVVHIIIMQWSILYFKGLPVKISIKCFVLFLKIVYSAGLDIWAFTVFQSICLPIFRLKQLKHACAAI